MSKVDLKLVKMLRDETGASIADIRKVVEEAKNDEKKARELLQKRSAKVAAKKSDRTTGEGIVDAYIHQNGKVGAWVEGEKKWHTAEGKRKMDVPIVGVVDTNSDPLLVNYPIPSNDDAVGAIKLLTNYLVGAWVEGEKKWHTAVREARKMDVILDIRSTVKTPVLKSLFLKHAQMSTLLILKKPWKVLLLRLSI